MDTCIKTKYIDFDVLELIKEFKNMQAPEKQIDCVLIGSKEKYGIDNSYAVTPVAQADQEITFVHQNKYVNT